MVSTSLSLSISRRYSINLVWKGYSQEEGIDYGETFAPVARMEGVRTLLAYVAHKGFKVY